MLGYLYIETIGENAYFDKDGFVVEIITMLANFVLEFLYNRFVVYRNSCDTQPIKK